MEAWEYLEWLGRVKILVPKYILYLALIGLGRSTLDPPSLSIRHSGIHAQPANLNGRDGACDKGPSRAELADHCTFSAFPNNYNEMGRAA